MKDGWRERLLAAIDADDRSDRAISLAAGLGPNFVSQMRGTKSSAPKKPNIDYVRKLALVLGKELSSIVGPTEEDAERQLRSALLAYGVHRNLLSAAILAVQGFKADSEGDEPPQQYPDQADTAPASRRRVREPFG